MQDATLPEERLERIKAPLEPVVSKLYIGILVIGLTVTAFVTGFVRKALQAQEAERFKGVAAAVSSEVASRLPEYSHGLLGARGLILASSKVTSEEWEAFVSSRDLPREFPGLLGFGYVERVARDQLNSFVAQTRQEGAENFVVRTSGELPDLFINKYIAPREGNGPSIGFDIGSDPKKREAAERAMRSGEVAVTTRVVLSQDLTLRQPAVLFFLPVYSSGKTPATEEERVRLLKGWVYGPVLTNRMFANVLRDIDSVIYLRLYDGPAVDPGSMLVESEKAEVPAEGAFRNVRQLDIGGRTWTIEILTRPAFFDATKGWTPYALALGGVLLSILVATVVWSLGSAQLRAKRIAAEATEELRHQRGELEKEIILRQAIFDHAQHIIIACDKAGIVTLFNRAAQQKLGYRADEFIGKTSLERIHVAEEVEYASAVLSEELGEEIPPSFETFVARARRALRDSSEWTYVRKDGSTFPVELAVSALRDSGGRIEGFLGIAYDISERREKDAQLLDALKKAEEATTTKSQFLANMSHEIRTPLTSIIGFADACFTDELPKEERREALSSIVRNGKHLLVLINDILDLSKSEAGKIELEWKQTALFDLVADIDSLMHPRAVEKKIAFDFDFAFPLPATIDTDPTRLKQILLNLVGNALKFTQKGGVKVLVSHEPERERINFAVVDTGIGMTPEEQTRLFHPFMQADSTTTRKFGGTGLGLSISAQLARYLGGEITFESSPGRGSVFTASVACGPLSEAGYLYNAPHRTVTMEAAHAAPAALAGRVLLAEDGPDNQQYITFLLRKLGLSFVTVEDGALAVEEASRGDYDVILMDMQMPRMDGYAATRTLRERGYAKPIIALTANVAKSDVEATRRAGCDDFLGKPFERQAFVDTLRKYIAKSAEKIGNGHSETTNMLAEFPELSEIVVRFCDNLPNRIQSMDEAYQALNWEDLMMHAHRLRGSAGAFGFTDLTAAAALLERFSRAQQLGEATQALGGIKAAVEKVLTQRHEFQRPGSEI